MDTPMCREIDLGRYKHIDKVTGQLITMARSILLRGGCINIDPDYEVEVAVFYADMLSKVYPDMKGYVVIDDSYDMRIARACLANYFMDRDVTIHLLHKGFKNYLIRNSFVVCYRGFNYQSIVLKTDTVVYPINTYSECKNKKQDCCKEHCFEVL